jgi:putative CocE/NonD family hydrolase
VAVYDIGGWFDGFCRETFKLYATMKDTNPSKIIVDPSYHIPLPQGFADYLGVDLEDLSDTANTEMFRWYDRWLKGVDNGIDTEPPVRIYVMNGEGWRYENEWPLARQQIHNLFFEADGALAGERLTEGADAYTTDYGHSSGWGEMDVSFLGMLGRPCVTDTFVRNRTTALCGYAPDDVPVRTALDAKCLTYTSQPLGSDVEVTGHPIVRLWVSSTAAEGDLFFYLEDVDESGEAVLVSENPLRIGFAGLVDDDEQINPNPGVDVLPDLPWHGFEDTDYVNGILADGNIVEIVNDLHPTSWVFKQGHRIRVSIACSDWPTFRLNPHLYAGEGDPTNLPGDYTAPTITVYRSSLQPSRIELPVIP